MMWFDDPALIAKYGSWVRVQVAFYDFIMTEGMNLCATYLKEKLMTEWRDGEDGYEKMMAACEQKFTSFEDAFQEFRAFALAEN